MKIFAAGNKYKTDRIEYNLGWKHLYVHGYKWIKSKQKFSGNALIHSIGQDFEIIGEE